MLNPVPYFYKHSTQAYAALPVAQSRRRGGLLGAKPPQTKLQVPQIETWNTINQLSFCQFLECQAPHTNAKHTRRNAKPPYWKLSGDDSAVAVANASISKPQLL